MEVYFVSFTTGCGEDTFTSIEKVFASYAAAVAFSNKMNEKLNQYGLHMGRGYNHSMVEDPDYCYSAKVIKYFGHCIDSPGAKYFISGPFEVEK